MNSGLAVLYLAACAFASVTSGCAAAGHRAGVDNIVQTTRANKTSNENRRLELTGPGLGRPTVFTFEQLSQMEMARLDNVLMQKSREPDELTSWRGPSLDALLAAAKVKPGRMTLTLEAADGYAIRCGLEDMKSAIVALQDGQGRWLVDLDKTCYLRLVAPIQPANYWLRNLCRISVQPVQEE